MDKNESQPIVLTSTAFHGLKPGQTVTLSGIPLPDRRWWVRLNAWILRRPVPMRYGSQQFTIGAVTGSTATLTPKD